MSNKPFAFLSKHHIRQSSEFDAVMKHGKRLSLACFVLCYLKTERDNSRLGMMVSKRFCPRAVDRNRIRRLVRENFRLNQKMLVRMDVVLLLRSSCEKISDQEQSTCLEKLFSQLIMQCDGSSSK